ncbi:hypothetical protein CsatB_014229 [Cannabis sativa]
MRTPTTRTSLPQLLLLRRSSHDDNDEGYSSQRTTVLPRRQLLFDRWSTAVLIHKPWMQHNQSD